MSRRTLKRLAVSAAIAVLAATFALVNRADAASLCGANFVKVSTYKLGTIGRAELYRNPGTKEACAILFRTGAAYDKAGWTNVIVTPEGKKGLDDPGSWKRYSGPVIVKATGCVTLFGRVDHAGKSETINKGGLCTIPKKAAAAVKATAVKATSTKATTTKTTKPKATSVSTSTSKNVPASAGNWYKLAKCESGNRNVNTGNGYYGYFQFSKATWRSVGGSGTPNQHNWQVQLKFAKKLQARSGWGQWPACSRKIGVR